jgi:hypothetical protein
MTSLEFRDGDLVVVDPLTSGVVLSRLTEFDGHATIFVAGPPFGRETEMDVATFAKTAEDVDVYLASNFTATREVVSSGDAEILPARMSDYPRVIARLASQARRTVGVVEVSEPVYGTVTPGVCGLSSGAIIDNADILVGEENPNEPRLPGVSFDVSQFDVLLDAPYELPRLDRVEPDPLAEDVAANVASIVPDGATLQIGIGKIASAVLTQLRDHTDLGFHSGLVNQEVVDLVDRKVITRGSMAAPQTDDGPFECPILTALALGPDRDFYEWLAESRAVAIGDLSRTHDPSTVASNPRFTSISSGIEVDLLGQVNAERIGTRWVSAPGGKPDFLRAARLSEGGGGIIALTSEVEGGGSKIIGHISDAGVVTSARIEHDYVVTEHHVADMLGSTRERAERLIAAAAPAYRADLRDAAAAIDII